MPEGLVYKTHRNADPSLNHILLWFSPNKGIIAMNSLMWVPELIEQLIFGNESHLPCRRLKYCWSKSVSNLHSEDGEGINRWREGRWKKCRLISYREYLTDSEFVCHGQWLFTLFRQMHFPIITSQGSFIHNHFCRASRNNLNVPWRCPMKIIVFTTKTKWNEH